MALPEELTFLLLKGAGLVALFFYGPGVLALSPWETPMDRAAVFKFFLTLLDPRFSDFELR